MEIFSGSFLGKPAGKLVHLILNVGMDHNLSKNIYMQPFGVKHIKSRDLGKYALEYLQSLDEVNGQIRDFDGLKTAISAKEPRDVGDLVRASVILSDFTTLTMTGGDDASIIIPTKGTRRVSLPSHLLEKHQINPDSTPINVGVFQSTSDQHKEFLGSLAPLIQRGWLLVRPARILMVKTDKKNWQMFDVEPDSGSGDWIVNGENQSRGEVPVRVETQTDIPFDLALPYLRGVSWNDFIKIVEDSTDTLATLRKGLRDAISALPVKEPSAVATIRRDVIDPELESLQRSFKKAIASHSFTIAGASVGIVWLSLSAILGTGTAASVSGLLGAGGLGLLAREYSAFRSKIEEMKDSPFYLYWRAKREEKTK